MKPLSKFLLTLAVPLAISASPMEDLYGYLTDASPSKTIPGSVLPLLPELKPVEEATEDTSPLAEKPSTLSPLSYEIYHVVETLLEEELTTLKSKKEEIARMSSEQKKEFRRELKPTIEQVLKLVRRSVGMVESTFEEDGVTYNGWRVRMHDHAAKGERFQMKIKEVAAELSLKATEKRTAQEENTLAETLRENKAKALEDVYKAELEKIMSKRGTDETTAQAAHEKDLKALNSTHDKNLKTNAGNEEMLRVINTQHEIQLSQKEKELKEALEQIDSQFKQSKKALLKTKVEGLQALQKEAAAEKPEFESRLQSISKTISELQAEQQRLKSGQAFWSSYYKTPLYQFRYKETASNGSWLAQATGGWLATGDPYYWITYAATQPAESDSAEESLNLPAHLRISETQSLFPFKDFFTTQDKKSFFIDEQGRNEAEKLTQILKITQALQSAYEGKGKKK